jgi:glycosyltransferase involved in cell wall biosynthesis
MMFAHTMGWPALDSEFYRVGTAMEGLCLRLADAVFSSSDCSADWCARHYGLDRERIPTIHTGVDTRLFCPRDAPKETRPTVVFAGRVDPNKGITVLVDAACILAKEFPGLQVRIIGRGEAALVERLRAKSRRCGFPDLLDLTGYLAAPELAAHLRRAHVFAAPSRYEGGPGFVYLEAMACGLPVVGCQGSGAAEAIRHGETGFLVPPGDTGALVESLRLLLSHPDLREAMGARARSFVEAEADSKVCLKRLESFYSAVATGASRSCFASEARS